MDNRAVDTDVPASADDVCENCSRTRAEHKSSICVTGGFCKFPVRQTKADLRRARTAEEVSAAFRSDPENERLYQESKARLDSAEATFRVTREVFDKFCEVADVEGYIVRIDFCAGLTAIGIKNEYVDDVGLDDSGPRAGRTFERE